jgi:uncharacterized protein YggE
MRYPETAIAGHGRSWSPSACPDLARVPPKIIGYLMSNSVTVEVWTLEKVTVVIEESLAAGANHFSGPHWALRDEQHAKLVALRQAAAKAWKGLGRVLEREVDSIDECD